MEEKFDAHFHIYPFPEAPGIAYPLKRWLRRSFAPWTKVQQELFLSLRRRPLWMRQSIEEIGIGYLVPHVAIESTTKDWLEQCKATNTIGGLLVAHPPLISNTFVSEICHRNPAWIPAWQYDRKSSVATFAEQMSRAKVRVLKIHPMGDGRGPEDSSYRELLKEAALRGWTVVIHTGAISSHIGFQRPHYGDVRHFLPWMAEFPRVRFVAAHMNIHEPEALLDLLQFPKNLWVTLSWQDEKTIERAFDRLGPDRLLYASDWPLIGDNGYWHGERINHALDRLRANKRDRKKIWLANAQELFRA